MATQENISTKQLKDFLAPAFADATEDDVSDAMITWARLSGRSDMDWEEDELADRSDILAFQAAQGLCGVTRVLRILANMDGEHNKNLRGYLESAAVALADVAADGFKRKGYSAAE